jgi:hypothetical protein
VEIRVGQSLASTVDATTVIVVRAPDGPVELTCGGAAMLDAKEAAAAGLVVPNPAAVADAAQLGKRYISVSGDLELLCTKGGGAGPLAADGDAMVLKSAKPLPASD